MRSAAGFLGFSNNRKSDGNLRITIVLPGFSKYPIGGYKVAYTYANFLAERGYAVKIIHALVLEGSQPLTRDWRRPVSSVLTSILSPKKPAWFALHDDIECVTLPYLKASFVPTTDVIIATEVQTATLVARVASRQKIEGYYFIQHYEDWSATPEFIDSTWRLGLTKIVIAPWLQEHAHVLGESAVLIPNGIDPAEFPAGPAMGDRVRDVAAMVSDVPWKRADLIVEVLNKLGNAHPDFKAVTFGTGERPVGLDDRFDHVRNPTKDQIRGLYQSSRIYLCASDAEGWHLPPAEAMSSGCAIVSTDIGGVRAYAEKVAQFSAVGDADGLAKSIEALMADPERCESLGRLGQLEMARYTPLKAASRFETVITGRR